MSPPPRLPEPVPTGVHRDPGIRNEGTRVLDTQGVSALRRPPPVKDMFVQRLQAIRRAYEGTPRMGCMVCALDPARGALAASARLDTPADGSLAHLTVGRHERCELRVTDAAVSLRHLALTARRTPTSDVRVRLLDLRTGLGMVGEDGRPLESVTVEGHLFVGLGRYVLMVLLGGEDLAFTDDGLKIFEALPERVFFDARQRFDPSTSPRRPSLDPEGGAFGVGTITRAREKGVGQPRSQVAIHFPPDMLRQPPSVLQGDRLGEFTMEYDGHSASIPLYAAQATDGVLLGRYERCEMSDIPFDLPDTVSRVHALVLQEADKLYVLDTASTFGLRDPDHGEHARLELVGPSSFRLGKDVLMRWSPGG